MQLRKKILSHFLLAIYLLVVFYHSVSYSYDSEIIKTSISVPHLHEDFNTVHHEHRFHVGIFHFLGHFFEYINYSNDLADEHLIVSQKSATKKVVDHNNSINATFQGINSMVFEVDAESLPDPPYYLSLLQKLKRPNTPLRAPPAVI